MTLNSLLPNPGSHHFKNDDVLDAIHFVQVRRAGAIPPYQHLRLQATSWNLDTNWMNGCERSEHTQARLTHDILVQQVIQHSVKRDLVAYAAEQAMQVQRLSARLEAQRALFAVLVDSVSESFATGETVSSHGIWRDLQERLSALATTVVPSEWTVEDYIGTHGLSRPIATVRRLATEYLSNTSRVTPRLKQDRESGQYSLVLDVEYPRASVSRESTKSFLIRYSEEVEERAQQQMTVFRLPF